MQDTSSQSVKSRSRDRRTLPARIAAVDLGSNSFHMVIARIVDGEPVIVDRLREQVQLADGLGEKSMIAPKAAARALDCLSRFGQRLAEMAPETVRAVGTNTLRAARNAEEFVDEAEARLGHRIEVVPGAEEARLIYLGVAHTLADDEDGRRLVLDIGGGSTECILGRRFEAQQVESMFMGCVGWSQRFFKDGRITRGAMKKAILAAEVELQPVRRQFREIGWHSAVGASGTIRAASSVILANEWGDAIDPASLDRLRAELIERGHVDELDLAGLKAERKPVFPGGIAILSALVERLRIQRLQTCGGALREGVVYDLLGRVRHEDVRERTIGIFQSRYDIDVAHAERVEKTALMLYERSSSKKLVAIAGARSFLSWAARLHEIGVAVSHRHHHRHGAYLLENADMPGFSQNDQQLLAFLVNAHRRKFPHGAIEELPADVKDDAARLALLLRLAVVLCRGRSPKPRPEIGVSWHKSRLKVSFPDGWLDDHDLTQTDLQTEQELLASSSMPWELELK